MKERILLVSEQFVRSKTNIDDNIAGKLLGPAITEATDFDLRVTIGDKLTDKLLDIQYRIDNGEVIPDSEDVYVDLIEICKYFLAYSALSNITLITAVKIGNAGLEQISDERMQPISISDSYSVRDYYLHKADFYRKRVQSYCINNKNSLPELTDNKCYQIQSNLNSAASCNIFLGGARGRGYKYKYKYDRL